MRPVRKLDVLLPPYTWSLQSKTQLSLPFTCRVVKLQLLIYLRYFIHHHNNIALWNRKAVKSCVGFRREHRADNRLGFGLKPFRQRWALVRIRDKIHGVARTHQVRLLNKLGGSHAASPLRWRGSFWGSFLGMILQLVLNILSFL